MKMSPTDLPAVLGEYLDAAIFPKGNLRQKFSAGAIQFIVSMQMSKIMEQYGPTMAMIGVLDSDGNIDIDTAHNIAKFAIDKSEKVDLLGYFMDSSDIELIYSIAKKYGRS